MSDPSRLILVDGMNFLYRAFHALPAFTTSSGESTGAVYGMINMLRKLMNDYAPQHMAVVFDAKGKTFRDELYSEYKANRPPMPPELRQQVQRVHDVVAAMGIPVLEKSGVEADDVIGTLARDASEAGYEVLMVSGDKDLAQLVGERTLLVDTMRETIYDPDGVVARWGVRPERMVDYLALIGDTSDNVPGVPKVGPKTAVKWLDQYGSLDALVDNAAQIGGKIGDNLRASLEQLALSRRLVTIKRDVAVDAAPAQLVLKGADEERLRELFATLEFNSFLAELGGLAGGSTEPEAQRADYELILDEEALDRWITRLQRAELFALDTETTSLDSMRAELVGLSFSDAPGTGAYVPVGHRYPGAPQQLSCDRVLQRLKPLLEDPLRPKVGQNLKYDLTVLASYGIALAGIVFDTMLESYVFDSTATRHDMDGLALKYLGYKTITFADVAGRGKGQLTFDQIDLEKAADYAAEDADITLRLHESLWPRLTRIPALQRLFETIEMPLVPVLARIERNGVKIDADMLRRQSGELAQRMVQIAEQAHDAAGQPFNIGSPKQIQEILYQKLELPVLSKTPKGQPSTSESVLQQLAADYDLPRLILEYRALSKLKSTYTDKLPGLVNPDTGRLHTSYHQAVAATGRLSSADPNLQNIPVRTAEGRRIREAFVPEAGATLVSVDYSQIELRIMAHLSGDEGLRQAFAQGVDVHRATAAEVFATPLEAVNDEQRRAAKAINFGLIYGMSAFGLARQLRIDRGAAQAYIERYFARYPGVKGFMDKTRAEAHEHKYVETEFGRRLYLPEINSSNYNRRQYAERTAINAPMQGTAADIMKMAMLAVDAWVAGSGLDVQVILQVHDELVLEVGQAALDAVTTTVPELMSGVAGLSVPLEVDIGIGANWAQAHA